ncbi:MAG: hypothetical protein LBF81_02755 [Prevotellaceae bacterium]|nr:hypothetical protein [Prevotellaceae bacterium]
MVAAFIVGSDISIGQCTTGQVQLSSCTLNTRLYLVLEVSVMECLLHGLPG